MNKPQLTRPHTSRAAIAVRTTRIARILTALVPEVASVRLTPVWTDALEEARRQTLVTLHYADGREIGADLAAHHTAHDLLHASFAGADWKRQHHYDLRTGRLTLVEGAFGVDVETDAQVSE